MADESVVIVNFQALESAISSFTTSSQAIAELAGELKSNAEAIRLAIKSDASDIYAGKVERLSSNFTNAEERLVREVDTLKAFADKERQAEAAAENLANSVSTFNMQ